MDFCGFGGMGLIQAAPFEMTLDEAIRIALQITIPLR
jgi:hypothetical protein